MCYYRVKMCYYKLLFLVTFLGVGFTNGLSRKTVTTEVGTIIGTPKTVVTVKDEIVEVDAFLGIPFAKPPVGNLRFQKPQPPTKFSTPFEAFQYGASCPQAASYPMPFPDVQSEDCLFLNVFVPKRPSEESSGRAVMIWVHGGGFAIGNSDLYDGSNFVSVGDVILVTFNYRLGMLGFFSTGDMHAPGNMGFWDQQLAFQWVQDNIKAFGGDPNRVTIFGESSGGISATLQAMYPPNKGLFHRILPQSGTATTMPIGTAEEAKESGIVLGKLLNCPTDTSENIVACLQGKDIKDFTDAFESIHTDYEAMQKIKLFTIVDGDFVKIHPKSITRESNDGLSDEIAFYRSIDNLSGYNSREGSVMIAEMGSSEDLESYKPSRESILESLLPTLAMWGYSYPEQLFELIQSEYTNWNNPDAPENVRDEIVKLYGDILFDIPAIEFARLHANSTDDVNSYIYYFTSRPSWNFVFTPSWVDGPNHGDELPLVFGYNEEWFRMANMTSKPEQWERDLSARIITYWANFAKTGNPNQPTPVDVEWPKYKLDGQKYMEFRRGADVIGEYLNARRANFWLNTVPAVTDAILHAQDTPSTSGKAEDGSCDASGKCDET